MLGLTELAAGRDWVQFDFGHSGVLELVQRSGEPQYDHARYQVGYAVADIESARACGVPKVGCACELGRRARRGRAR